RRSGQAMPCRREPEAAYTQETPGGPGRTTQFAGGTTRGNALQDVVAHGWQALRAVQVRPFWAFPALCPGAIRPGRGRVRVDPCGVAHWPGVAVPGFRAGCLR